MKPQPEEICLDVQASLVRCGLFSANGNQQGTWRVAPAPYFLSPGEVEFFSTLGGHLLKFYRTLNQFYFDSLKGKLPAWFVEYLDLGKPRELLDYGRMNRFRRRLPGILRPDAIATEDGFAITELDSVPGGFGLLAHLMSCYGETHANIVGAGGGGIPGQFYRMVELAAGKPGCSLAIVVSRESEDYLDEMKSLSALLHNRGLPVFVARPQDLVFREDGLFLPVGGSDVKIDAVYRFFELYDLKNIPKSELLLYGNKKGTVTVTPPYKPFLEEKLVFALFHHPCLAAIWEKSLGRETFGVLTHLIPSTWILDNRDLPPHAVIPGLNIRGAPVRDWRELNSLTQKERELVIKISGFSPLSWGGRGVTVGHDVSADEWMQTLRERLENFERAPAVLQTFRKGKRVNTSYWCPGTQALKEMECRVRLTPYYFVTGEDDARLGGILATLCPKDKKKIHGMADAVMVPCATGP